MQQYPGDREHKAGLIVAVPLVPWAGTKASSLECGEPDSNSTATARVNGQAFASEKAFRPVKHLGAKAPQLI
jgi:hypothetical protein